MPEYTVSVRLMTYNHEPYIREAIESILMQRTNFNVEVVIGDDFSRDNTLGIIRQYASTNNIHLKILEREIGGEYWKERQKKGRLYNFTNILENCTGKYIALLDGDDYWTNPYKLQRQVDFLEQHTDCVLCHHWQEIAVLNNTGEFVRKPAPKEGHGYFDEEITTVAKVFSNELRVKIRNVMFRNVISGFPEWYYKVEFGDVPLSILLSKFGKFGFINEPMAVYRMTDTGYSRRGSKNWLFTYNHYIAWIRIWEYCDLYYEGTYRNESLKTIYYFYGVIIKKYKHSLRVFCMILNYALLKSRYPIFLRLRVVSLLMSNFLFRKMKTIKMIK